MRGVIPSVGNDVVDWINNKIPNRLLPDNPIPGFSQGGVALRGGWARVGEHGPETLRLPGGTQVHPMGRRGSSAPVNVTIYDVNNKLIGTMRGVAENEVRTGRNFDDYMERWNG